MSILIVMAIFSRNFLAILIYFSGCHKDLYGNRIIRSYMPGQCNIDMIMLFFLAVVEAPETGFEIEVEEEIFVGRKKLGHY